MKNNRVRISASDVPAVTAIRMSPGQSIQALLTRLGTEYVQGLPREAYATALYDTLCDDRQLILTILPEVLISFLIRVWENETIEMEEKHWDYVKYLSMLGFLYSQRESSIFGAPDMLFYVGEMKEEFYFLLKSRKSRAIIHQYEEWEQVIMGLLYYYGVADLESFHRAFSSVMAGPAEKKRLTDVKERPAGEGKPISFAVFESFLKLRCSFWGTGFFLRSLEGQTEYFSHNNVEDVNNILFQRDKYDVPWFIPDRDSCIKLYAAGGLDNSWAGFQELVKLVGDELQMDYYRTNVVVRTMIRLIQNGCSLEELCRKAGDFSSSDKLQNDREESILRKLYYSVPLFFLKGNNRKQYDLINERKQLKNRRKLFTMIDGGKRS
ncbi:MAG: hypothetical protein IJI25_11905 [Eubacterium sp.]|nr:hypothetical protein [Eubacterium sp.]